MNVTAARSAALEVVSRVRERKAYAHETLDAVLNARKLSREDAAFATRLAYETVASRGTVDEIVSGFVTKKSQIEPRVSDAMAVATSEILFMSTASHAAVSQGVELVRSVRPEASRMANAILRRIAEKAGDFPWGDSQTDDAALARLYRHPVWLASLWIAELGRERAASVMAANNEPAPLFVSVLPGLNTSATALAELQEAGVDLTPGTLAGVWRAKDASRIISAPQVHEGRVIVMDEAARFAAEAVPLVAGSRVAEIGAGRGSKSLVLAARAAELGAADVLAVDIHEFKLDRLAEAAQRLGLQVRTALGDATQLDAEEFAPSSFDSVLIDAPCSGLGTLRRHPDRRWTAQPSELESVAALGTSLLAEAAKLVRPGGFMVYSTCTIARAENQDVILDFLGSQTGAGFRIDPLSGDIPADWVRFMTEEGFFQSLPEPGGPDGHFVARLVRG